MQNIRQPTFAVPPAQQMRPHFLADEQRSHHLHETLVAPQQVVIGKAIERRFPPPVIARQIFQRARIPAEHLCRQRGPNNFFMRWLRHCQ